MTIVLFLAILFALVLVHELGHFMVAKWTKMRVDEFAIGFPPRLFSKRVGETIYSLNLLPIGGYVKIYGENGEEEAPFTNTDKSRAFNTRPRLHQALVLIAGVVMNVLTAWLIFFTIAMIGTPTIVAEGSGETGQLLVTEVVTDSAAALANIPLGAEITVVNTNNDTLDQLTPANLTQFVRTHDTATISLTYSHNGNDQTVNLVPQTGVIENEPDRPIIGLGTALVTTVREGPISALKTATIQTGTGLYYITLGIGSLFASIATLSTDLSSVTGPVGIAGLVGDAASFGLISLLSFTAFISLNLAIINLLPIPALDGGRLLFVAIEAVIRRPINPKWMARVNLTGFTLLILLMIAVTYGDVTRLL